MRGQLDRRLRAHAGVPVSVIAVPAERLPLADASIDHAVSTLVLCSVTDLAASLAELHRVLRPGGSLRFMEHVQTANQSATVLTPEQKTLAEQRLGYGRGWAMHGPGR